MGRFQVTPFKAPPSDHSHPRPPHRVAPPLAPPPASSQSESSESSTEDGSQTESSITSAPSPRRLLGYHDNHRGEGEEGWQEEAEEGVAEWRAGRRRWEGSADSSATSNHEFNQPWNRSAPLRSPGQSDSDAEEMWAELQELRER